jgi:hypothetical protein
LLGNSISLDLRVLFELCILTAMITELRSGPKGLKRTSRVNVKEHSLGMQLGGVRSTSQVAKSFIGTGLKDDPDADGPKIF